MREIIPAEPFILCKRMKLQEKIGEIFIAGQEDKTSTVKLVVKISNAARQRNIMEGDVVVTRQPRYPELPVALTETDEVPYDSEDTVEIVDPCQVIAIYRQPTEEINA